jgi:hypothetical protein
MDARNKYHETACTSLPEDKHLDVRNMSKTLRLNYYCEMCALCWFLLHNLIKLNSLAVVGVKLGVERNVKK